MVYWLLDVVADAGGEIVTLGVTGVWVGAALPLQWRSAALGARDDVEVDVRHCLTSAGIVVLEAVETTESGLHHRYTDLLRGGYHFG